MKLSLLFSRRKRHEYWLRENAAARVLMICTANICRSPLAEGAFRLQSINNGVAHRIFVDSAGTHVFQAGFPPDLRGQNIARRQGIDISRLKARQITAADFDFFDYLIIMDQGHRETLSEQFDITGYQEKIHLLMDFAPTRSEREIPDPYYGSVAGFVKVMELIQAGTAGLLTTIRQQHRL